MQPEIIYKRIKNGYAKITKEGNLQITVPHYLRNDKKFVQELIEKGEKLFARYNKRNHIHIKSEYDIMLFGELVPLEELGPTEKKRSQHLKEILYDYAQPILEKYSKMIGMKYRDFTIRKVQSKWGSCTHDQKIMLNLNLVHLPTRLITYVIIHEVCHLKVKDHTPRFRKVVELYCPNYKILRKELRNFVLH